MEPLNFTLLPLHYNHHSHRATIDPSRASVYVVFIQVISVFNLKMLSSCLVLSLCLSLCECNYVRGGQPFGRIGVAE
jgi:hypothetical protein